MDSLTEICCNTIINKRIYYHNLIPVKLENRLDDIKCLFYPDEYFEDEDEIYYDEYDKKFYVPENYYINFSLRNNIKIIKTEIFFVFKKDTTKDRYTKYRVIHNKKFLEDFKSSIAKTIDNYLIFGKNEYPTYNRKYMLLDTY